MRGGPALHGVRDPGSARSVPRESADKVVLHTGKYEELIVCSHEIAASTAQLVAASKVRLRARLGSGRWWTGDTLRVARGPGNGGRSRGAHPDPRPRAPR